ncbi:MAG: hypothetical protein ACYCO9_16740 [Streptosporangiaceae bacterium]
MENFDQPPHPGASNPTEPISFPPTAGGGPRDDGPSWGGSGRPAGQTGGDDGRRGRNPIARWVAGAAAAAILISGGTLAGVALAGPSGPAASTTTLAANSSPLSGSLAGMSGSTATVTGFSSGAPGASRPGMNLRGCLKSARALRAKGDLTAARAKRQGCLRGLRMLGRLLRRGLHGEITVRTKSGGTATIAFERGVVQSVTSSSVVVRAADGTAWTWALTGATKVGRAGHPASVQALGKGETVIVIGPAAASGHTARRIGIRK